MTTNTKLAIKYKQGNKQAGLLLIQNFSPLITKFANIIYHGKFDSNDSHTIEFLKMLMSNSSSVKKDGKKITSLLKGIFRVYDYEDIIQELKLILLNLTAKYDESKLNYESYIRFNYKYYVKKYVISIVDNSPVTISISEFEKYDTNNEVWDLFSNFTNNNIDETMYKTINHNWVSGKTCNDLFKRLEAEERLILKYLYIDGKTGLEISEKLKVPKSTIYDRINSIKNKLSKIKKEDREKVVILQALEAGKTHKEIGDIIGKHQSTATRKIQEIV